MISKAFSLLTILSLFAFTSFIAAEDDPKNIIYHGVISAIASVNNKSSISVVFNPIKEPDQIIGVSRTGSVDIILPSPSEGSWSSPTCHLVAFHDSRIPTSHLIKASMSRNKDKKQVITGNFDLVGSPDYLPLTIDCVITAPNSHIHADAKGGIDVDGTDSLILASNADTKIYFTNPPYSGIANPNESQVIQVKRFAKLASSISVNAAGSFTAKPMELRVKVNNPTKKFTHLVLDGYDNVYFGPHNPVSAAYGYIANCTMQNGEFRYGLHANVNPDEPRYVDFIFLDGTVIEGNVDIVCPTLTAMKRSAGVASVVSVYANHNTTLSRKGEALRPFDGQGETVYKQYTYETSTIIKLKNSSYSIKLLFVFASIACVLLAIL